MVLVVALVIVLILVFVLLLILTISANVRCWRPSSGVRVGDDGFVVVVEVAAEVDELMVGGWVVIGDDWE